MDLWNPKKAPWGGTFFRFRRFNFDKLGLAELCEKERPLESLYIYTHTYTYT